MGLMIRLLAITALSVVALCSCSSDRGDPLAAGSDELTYGGSLSSGTNLANAAVTDENKYALCENVFWQLYFSYLIALKQAGTAAEFSTVRIVGDNRGYAIVEAQPITIIQPGGQHIRFNATVTYHDYSVNGKLFMGGMVSFNGLWADLDGSLLPFQLHLNGGVNFAGDYSGAIEFGLFSLAIDQEGSMIPVGIPVTGIPLEGSVKILSSGNEFFVNPYPFMPGSS